MTCMGLSVCAETRFACLSSMPPEAGARGAVHEAVPREPDDAPSSGYQWRSSQARYSTLSADSSPPRTIRSFQL